MALRRFGWKVVDKPVHVHDLHATILYYWESITRNYLPV